MYRWVGGWKQVKAMLASPQELGRLMQQWEAVRLVQDVSEKGKNEISQSANKSADASLRNRSEFCPLVAKSILGDKTTLSRATTIRRKPFSSKHLRSTDRLRFLAILSICVTFCVGNSRSTRWAFERDFRVKLARRKPAGQWSPLTAPSHSRTRLFFSRTLLELLARPALRSFLAIRFFSNP